MGPSREWDASKAARERWERQERWGQTLRPPEGVEGPEVAGTAHPQFHLAEMVESYESLAHRAFLEMLRE